MNFKKWTFAFLMCLGIASCIQDEALNSEAAIDACTGTDVQLAHINPDSKEINVYVNKGADLEKQQLLFTLPEGATLTVDEHKPNDLLNYYDFSEGDNTRRFTVTSEDGQWKSSYTVRIIRAEVPTSFHFEELQAAAGTEYDILYEFEPSTSSEASHVLQWASGNPGYKLTSMANSRTDYPTVQVTNGYKGKCVKLTTCSTGSFGEMVKMYIAAGNLFIGSFDVSNALKDALKATNFGIQFYKTPKSLKGYYKFKPGEVYTEEGKEQPDTKDRFDIYGILYEAEDNSFMLNGSNNLTSDKIVLLARIDEETSYKETDTWTEFNLTFEQKNGKSIDPVKLKDGKYKLSIVLSSSERGAYFKGAVGSTLYVDELELICEEDNK